MPHLLCLGLGFSAQAAARRMAARGWRITGTARTLDGASAIARLGYGATVFDGSRAEPGLASAIASATHVLVSVPPGSGDPVLAHHAADLAAAPELQAIVYLSTIGVYGDTGGAWIDETAPARPQSERSRARLAAENAWSALAAARGCRIAILRLAGIYGPGRSAIDDVRTGRARRIVKPGQVFNRIHVEDIGAITESALLKPEGTGIFNVADAEPAPPQDVVAYAAQLLGVPPPPEIPIEHAQLSPMGLSFYAELKRVRSPRLGADLGITLQYPTYREGLAHILSRS